PLFPPGSPVSRGFFSPGERDEKKEEREKEKEEGEERERRGSGGCNYVLLFFFPLSPSPPRNLHPHHSLFLLFTDGSTELHSSHDTPRRKRRKRRTLPPTAPSPLHHDEYHSS